MDERAMGLIRSKKDSESAAPKNRPAADTAPASGGANSFIGPGMVLAGDCETDGTVRVEGHVQGNVRAGHLTLAVGGRVDGDVNGARADDGGTGQPSVIHGHVGGAVRTLRVEVGTDGTVGSGIEAREAVIHGRVTGGVVASDRLLIAASAVIEGDVRAPRLGLEEGARVVGSIRAGAVGKE
jgi:cytoskeletal protein CcmA (bactofilin family)